MRTPVARLRIALPGLFLLVGGLLAFAPPVQGQDLEDPWGLEAPEYDLDNIFSDPDLLDRIACIQETLDGDLRECTWSEGIQQCREGTYDSEARCLLESKTFLDRAECRILGILDEVACLPVLGWILDVV